MEHRCKNIDIDIDANIDIDVDGNHCSQLFGNEFGLSILLAITLHMYLYV